jgi:hypothetical protein
MRLLLVNSTVAFVISLMLMLTTHEFAHGIAYLSLGLKPTIFPGQVVTDMVGTTDQQVLGLLAGPIGSLVIGLAVLLAGPVARGFWGLVLFWFGTLSVQEFTGYLMTGPFLALGDIGRALQLLSSPWWVYWIGFAVGAVGTALLGRFATHRLVAMTNPDVGERSRQLRLLGLFAWLLGSALFVLIGLISGGIGTLVTPVGLVELLAVFTSGIFLTVVRVFMGRNEITGRGLVLGWPLSGIGVAVGLVVARQLILGPGLRL